MNGYEDFKKDILVLTKIDLNSYKEKQMKRRIDTLISKNRITSYKDYVALIKKDKEKFEQFVNFLTINVSEFYRNAEQWVILDKEVFPALIKKFGKSLKVWSAACSTGDEPYSLVMALSKHIPIKQIKIIATDIDKQVLDKARMGLYNEKSIAAVPAEFKSKYFTKIGSSYQISDEIKRQVEFKEHNLLKDPYPSGCHLIVCRNVLIYFTEEAKEEIYKKIQCCVDQRGYSFYWKYRADYELQGTELSEKSSFLLPEELNSFRSENQSFLEYRKGWFSAIGNFLMFIRDIVL